MNTSYLENCLIVEFYVEKIHSCDCAITKLVTPCFMLQWLLGLLTFLVPGFSAKIRARFLHVHVFLGVAIFALALLSALLGVMEKLVLK